MHFPDNKSETVNKEDRHNHREGNTVSTLLDLDLCVRRVLAYCLGTYISVPEVVDVGFNLTVEFVKHISRGGKQQKRTRLKH